MTTQTQFSPTTATKSDLIAWLELRYEKRLALYPDILTHEVFRHTAAARRLRVLKASASILKGEGTYLLILKDLIVDLILEKNTLFEIYGYRRFSYDMFEKVIELLQNIEK